MGRQRQFVCGFADQSGLAGLFAVALVLGACMTDTVAAQGAVQSAAKAANHRRGAVAVPAEKQPETAQSALDAASTLLAGGKTDQAIEKLTTVIAGGKLPAPLMARALYMRGKAYRQQAKPALAISDLTSALWIKKGLEPADRVEATLQRAGAYSEAGLPEQGQALAGSSAARRKGQTVASTNRSVDGGPVLGWASSTQSATAPQARSAAVGAPPKPPAATPHARQRALATIAAATVPVAAATARPNPLTIGRFRSRVALVHTKAEAEAIVAKLKVQYAAVLGEKQPEIGQASFGNMGSYFQVCVGPFVSAVAARSMCARLHGSGLDCVAIDQ